MGMRISWGRRAFARFVDRAASACSMRREWWRSAFSVLVMLLLGLRLCYATSYVYDSNGRLVAVTRDDGTSVSYVYDSVGNLQQVLGVPVGQLAILGFDPKHGGPGVAVTINGQGFDTTIANDIVAFNGLAATVTAATATVLTAIVPAGAATGPISVTVGGTTATSKDAFVVDGSGQPPVITSFSPTIASAGTAITLVGQHLDPMDAQTSVKLNGRIVTTTSVTDSQIGFPVPVQTGSGKVSVTTPYGQATSATDLIVAPPGISPADIVATGRLTVDGPSQTLSIGTANKYGALLFDAPSPGWLSLQFNAITTTASSIGYTIYDTRNVVIASGNVSSASPSLHLPMLRVGGTYTLILLPAGGTAQLTVNVESGAAPNTVAPGITIATVSANQSKRLVFAANAGDNLGLAVAGVTTTSSYHDVYVQIYDPVGTSVAGSWCNATSGCAFGLQNTKAGTYRVVVTPEAGATMGATMTLSQDVVSGVIPRDNGSLSMTMARPAQNGWMTFTGTAGETIAFNVTQTTSPAGGGVTYTIYKPDGSFYTNTGTGSWSTLNLTNLPMTGTYKVYVHPTYPYASVDVQAKIGSGVIGSFTEDGPSQSFSTSLPNQAAYLSFAANAGDNLGLAVAGVTTTSSYHDVYVQIYDPVGTSVAGSWCNATSGCAFGLQNTKAGTYRVVVTPEAGATMGFTVTLSKQ